ncbi:TetR/AcrR family transcriptional regulator [Tunturiibacter gelidoferens]|uniref:TetR/AcrR family transcriptional repressor of nem operon n=1 Tax=Tunturiibacter gelidiferens TaxID=3069689 RepID=A0ACC5NTG6_9BACT|nr:TetR/AcrR family transcriptional regulator [Edaphobacter lichenicola]MBB5337746.1 TetR/AcrR family transcriptional repressor of nem operon [Edaphobacter lichenicola]
MRVSRTKAAENRERILDVATRLFRERGIDGIGVADLMKSAGLTHGGFYGHFKSKDDLVAQACGRAVQKMRDNWIKVLDQTTGDPVHALADTYLAAKHRDNAGRGCTIAALGSEIARQSTAVRHIVTEELKPFIDYLSAIVQGSSASLRRERAITLYASLVGAIVIARAVDDAAFSNETLHAVANGIRSKSTPRPPKGGKKRIAIRTPRVAKP